MVRRRSAEERDRQMTTETGATERLTVERFHTGSVSIYDESGVEVATLWKWEDRSDPMELAHVFALAPDLLAKAKVWADIVEQIGFLDAHPSLKKKGGMRKLREELMDAENDLWACVKGFYEKQKWAGE